jgi:hypothetical protein
VDTARGGRAQVRRALQTPRLQPTLTVGAPDDEFEHEADSVADQVMRIPDAPDADSRVQRMCRDCEEEERIHRAADSASSNGGLHISPEVDSKIHALRRGGEPLSNSTLSFFESRFGRDLSSVRVHTDAEASESARAIGSRAYTLGNHIVFGGREYAPTTVAGRRLLAHELTHVMQQNPDDQPTQEIRRQPAAPPPVFEHATELGGLSVGNFDFHFSNCSILIWVWVKFQFTSDITAAEQAAFKTRFFNAIHGTWAHTGFALQGLGTCPCPTVPIEVHCEETTSGYYHKLVDVEKQSDVDRRPMVISDINVNLGTSDATLAHEFGHVLGLYDEYDGGFFENIMFWHKNQPGDPNALMSEGTELRPRYFEHYRQRVQETAAPGCDYKITSPVPPVP